MHGRSWFSNFRVHGVRQISHLKQAKLGTLEYSRVNQAITVWIVKNNTIRLPRRRKKNDKIHVLFNPFYWCPYLFNINNYQNLSEWLKNISVQCRQCCAIFLEQVTWLFCLHHLGRLSTPAYASTGFPAHLISVLPVRSRRCKENS